MQVRMSSKKAKADLRISTKGGVGVFIKKLSRLPIPEDGVFFIWPEFPEEARGMLRCFCESIESGEAPPPEVLRFLKGSFEEILKGKASDRTLASKALGLAHRRRARPIVNEERDTKITNEIMDLMESGSTLLRAALELAEKYGIRESNIQKIYSRYKEVVKLNRELAF